MYFGISSKVRSYIMYWEAKKHWQNTKNVFATHFKKLQGQIFNVYITCFLDRKR